MRSPKLSAHQPPPPAAAMAAAGVARRKGTSSRQWLVVSASGCSSHEEVGKQTIMRRTGLPARDLRVLDPVLSYPSTILGRERAIVINLEHIRAIITATEVLIPNSKDPIVAPFVQELQARVTSSNGGASRQAMGSSDTDGEATPKSSSNFPLFGNHIGTTKDGSGVFQEYSAPYGVTASAIPEGDPKSAFGAGKDVGAKALPFEFKVLEVCLESACRCLESETSTLEQEAYPALDELTSKISTLNLERVRQIKSRLVAISGRVQKVRDELEHLLDDDMDMAEMYLTDKFICQPVGETSLRVDLDDDSLDLQEDGDGDLKRESESSRGSLGGFKPDIEELEMLLEAYFVQIDGTLNKLSTLREYVDDTEDYINIMLDEKQNQLLQMGVMLSTATLVVTAGVVVVGIFGMNIGIDLFDDGTPHSKFWETTFGTVGGCIVLYILAIGWGKRSGLLQ